MRFCLQSILAATVLAGFSSAVLWGADTDAPDQSVAARAVWAVKVDARTGKLVRSLVQTAKPGAAYNANLRGLVQKTAQTFDLSPLLVDSVIQVESNYNPFAVSDKGAQGLMQLMPETAQRFGVTNSFDPKQNIEAGVRYLKLLEDTFQDDRLAIAAYNAGEKAVAKYKDVPPYPETVSYVAKVGNKYGQAKRAAAHRVTANQEIKDAEKPAGADGATHHVLAYIDAQGRLHLATE